MSDQPAPPPRPSDTPAEGAAKLFEEAAVEVATRTPPPTPAEIAPLFPDLDVLAVLGAGGMGVVYKARHRRLDRLVALKILPRELAKDPQFAERFAREARMLARLDHPLIVRVHDFGQTGELCFLVLEYVDGANLRQVMASGRLTPAEALAIVPQMCDALQYAHDQGVVHRDIKPENVLLDAKGRVKITDFGLAKLVDRTGGVSGLTATGQVVGTFQYMAPEQVRTPHDVDHRADLYSLGVVFYEMLTGELPMGRFEPPSQTAGLDARIDHIVLHALEREREHRYQRAEEIKTDVASLGAAAPPLDDAAATTTDPRHRRGRGALWVALIALPAGWTVLALIHAIWGGVERGTDDALAREWWKGIGAGVTFVLGALCSVAALLHGAEVPAARRLRRLAVSLAALNLAALLILIVSVAHEVHGHSNLRPMAQRPGPDRTGQAQPQVELRREVQTGWERILRRLNEGARAVNVHVLESEYAARERLDYEAERTDYLTLREAGMGPFLLRLGPAELAAWRVQEVEPLRTVGRVRVLIVSADGQHTLRFPMSLDDGVWRLATGFVEEGFGPR